MSGSLPGLSQSGRACQGGGREVCDKMLVASVGPRRPLPHPHSSPAPLLPSLPTPVLPQIPPLPPAQSLQGEETPRDCGLKGGHSPPWGLAGVLNLLSPLSLKCSELWDQTASDSNPSLLLSAGSATRFCNPGLRVSGREWQIQMPTRSWRGTGWPGVELCSLRSPQPHSATAHHQVEETRV